MPATSSLVSGVIRTYAIVKATTGANATRAQCSMRPRRQVRLLFRSRSTNGGGALFPRLRCVIWVAMTSPSETSLVAPRVRPHRLVVVAGLYWLDFGYFLTVGMALEQSCELFNSPSGKPPNCPVQGEPNRLKLTRQVLASRITGRVGDGGVGRGRGRRAIKVRRLLSRCCRRGEPC